MSGIAVLFCLKIGHLILEWYLL